MSRRPTLREMVSPRKVCMLKTATARGGREPPFWVVKRAVHPYKSAVENRFTLGNGKGA